MATFYAAQILRASQLNAIASVSSYSNVDLTSRTTTTGYTETLSPAGLCGVAFIAPISGTVRIDWKADMSNATASALCAMSFNVRSGTVVGSGTLFLGASDDIAARNDNPSTGSTGLHDYSCFSIVSGLTAGASYNVSLSQRTNAGTLTVARRNVIVTQMVS